MENQTVNPQTRVGVGVLIEREGQLLMLRRKNVHGSGTWSTPGGHLDFGESFEECAKREAKEETDIDVFDIEFVAITNDYFEKENRHYITVWMKASAQAGTENINAAYEMDQVGWFPWKELPSPLFGPLEKLMTGKSYPQLCSNASIPPLASREV